ncbi:MAG TPA: glutathione S-transferase family protein [Coleofasciculaceae cyanobacterium]
MITLYIASPQWGLASVSPACMELETWLRMANLSYKTILVTAEDFAKAPKGKIPFIDYGGQLWGDTNLIMNMFRQTEQIDLDAGLTAAERSISLAFRRLLKEHLYWGGIEVRYKIEENWQHYRTFIAKLLGDRVPTAEADAFVETFRQTIRDQMYHQGLGRLSSEELLQLIAADLQALSDFLADKPFFMGDRPTTLDATAYGHIGNFIQPPYDSPIVDFARQKTNLCEHYQRMSCTFFGDRIDAIDAVG